MPFTGAVAGRLAGAPPPSGTPVRGEGAPTAAFALPRSDPELIAREWSELAAAVGGRNAVTSYLAAVVSPVPFMKSFELLDARHDLNLISRWGDELGEFRKFLL